MWKRIRFWLRNTFYSQWSKNWQNKIGIYQYRTKFIGQYIRLRWMHVYRRWDAKFPWKTYSSIRQLCFCLRKSINSSETSTFNAIYLLIHWLVSVDGLLAYQHFRNIHLTYIWIAENGMEATHLTSHILLSLADVSIEENKGYEMWNLIFHSQPLKYIRYLSI